jgi:hypothetical protein
MKQYETTRVAIQHCLFRLVEAMKDMMKDQERDFNDACAQDEILTAREYLGLGGDYLGELRTVISSKGLGLINKQYRIARKAVRIPSRNLSRSAATTARFLSSSGSLVVTRSTRNLDLRRLSLNGRFIHAGDYENRRLEIHTEASSPLRLPLPQSA